MLKNPRLVVLSATLVAAVALPVAGPADAVLRDPAAYGDASVSTARVVVPMMFPVIGPTSYSDTYLACRSGCARRHFGQDLMGPKMRMAVATFNGYVHSIKRESTPGEGNYLTLKGDNGWSANYIHMNNDTPGTDDGRGTANYFLAPGIVEGKRVFAGELLGWVGDSGNAESTAPHLHFELRKGDPWSGTVYNAYASLNAARRLTRPTTSGPHPQGAYVKGCTTTCSVWQLDGGQRRLLLPEVAKELRLDPRGVIPITQNEARWYRQGRHVALPDGRAYKGPDGTVWFVTDGLRYVVPDAAALAALGIAQVRVRPMTLAGLNTVPVAPADAVLPTGVLYNGALLRVPGSTTTWWYVTNGQRRLVPDVETLRSWGLFGDDAMTAPVETVVPDGEPEGEPEDGTGEGTEGEGETPAVVLPPFGPTLLFKDGALLRSSTGRRYVVSNGTRRPFVSYRAYEMYGYASVLQQAPPNIVISRLPAGAMLP